MIKKSNTPNVNVYGTNIDEREIRQEDYRNIKRKREIKNNNSELTHYIYEGR